MTLHTLPIALREVKSIPRRKGFRWKRVALLAPLGLVIVFGLPESTSTTAGLVIFQILAVLMLITTSLVAASDASLGILKEKEGRTLGLLFLSDISSGGIVRGKLVASLFSTIMAILMSIPMVLLTVSMGGISGSQVLSAMTLLLCTILLTASLGILAGCLATNERSLQSLLVLLMLVCFAFPVVGIVGYCAYRDMRPPPSLFRWVSPFSAMISVIEGKWVRASMQNGLVSLIVSAVLLWLSPKFLERSHARQDRPDLSWRLRDWARHKRPLKRWTRRPAVVGNPVLWRDFHYRLGGARQAWLTCAASVLPLSLIIAGVAYYTGDSSKAVQTAMVSGYWSVFSISAVFFWIGSLLHCASAFRSERRSRTFEVLLTSDLTDREIVHGKWRAAIRAVRPWLICAIIAQISFAAVNTETFFEQFVDGFWGIVAFSQEYLFSWLGLSALALCLSLRLEGGSSFGLTIITFFAWHIFKPIFLRPLFRDGALFVISDMFFFLLLGAVSYGCLLDSLRRWGIGEAGRKAGGRGNPT